MFGQIKGKQTVQKPVVFRKGVKPVNDPSSGSENIFSDVSSMSEDEEFEIKIATNKNDNILPQAPKTKEDVIVDKRHESHEHKDKPDYEEPNEIYQSESDEDREDAIAKEVEQDIDPVLRIYKETREDNKEQDYAIAKPVFIPKDLRQDEKHVEHSKDRINKLRVENKYLSTAAIRLKDESEPEIASLDLPNDDDTLDSALEFSKWKLRELTRIHRDQEERVKSQRLKEETERRRQLTDEQRIQEDKVIGKSDKPLKSDYRYMQKYYSGLTFFQDKDDEVYNRDFNIAVGFDTFDKSALPRNMQVRGDEIGKKGRSKYKDLFSEDTGNYDPNYLPDKAVADKVLKRQGGYKSTR